MPTQRWNEFLRYAAAAHPAMELRYGRRHELLLAEELRGILGVARDGGAWVEAFGQALRRDGRIEPRGVLPPVASEWMQSCVRDSPERLGKARSEERRVGKKCRSRWSPY